MHGWIKVGPGGSLPSGDASVRKANVARAKTGVLKRAQRQNMTVAPGLAVAGGSSDVQRPLADALTGATQNGKDHYIIPTAQGMAATDHKGSANSVGDYIRVQPDGAVTKMERAKWGEPSKPVAVLSDHTVAAVLERHLSATRTAAPKVKPAPRAKADPDVVSHSVAARLVKDIQKTPALQTAEFKARAKEIARKSGFPELIPSDWANKRRAIEMASA